MSNQIISFEFRIQRNADGRTDGRTDSRHQRPEVVPCDLKKKVISSRQTILSVLLDSAATFHCHGVAEVNR